MITWEWGGVKGRAAGDREVNTKGNRANKTLPSGGANNCLKISMSRGFWRHLSCCLPVYWNDGLYKVLVEGTGFHKPARFQFKLFYPSNSSKSFIVATHNCHSVFMVIGIVILTAVARFSIFLAAMPYS